MELSVRFQPQSEESDLLGNVRQQVSNLSLSMVPHVSREDAWHENNPDLIIAQGLQASV